MRATFIAQVIAVAATVSALQITFPSEADAKLDFSKENTLTWTSVESDPDTVRLELVNNVVSPPTREVIAEEVKIQGDSGSYKIEPLVATTGKGYQLRFVGILGQNTGILSQSQQFTIEKAAKNETKPTTTPSAGSSQGSAPSNTAAESTPSPTETGAASSLKALGGAGILAAVVAILM